MSLPQPSRGGQLKRGCAASKGVWILALHADTVLAPGWSHAVRAHLNSQKAGWFSLRFCEGGLLGRALAMWANLRSQWGLPYGDQGLLIPRELYDAVGGYTDIPLMEDVAIVRSLAGRMQRIDAVAITSAEKYQKQGWFRRGGRNVLTLLRYFMGVDPTVLAAAYRR